MTRPKSYDALVVGARCAGASVAMLLARAGLRVLAIDKSAYGADALSTHALMRGGVLQLHRWGVLDAIRASGAPAIRSTTFHYGDETVPIAIAPAHGVEALYAPRRTVLDRALVDAAVEAGAEVAFGTRLVDLIRSPAGRVIGATISVSGRPLAVRAGVVIGADGVKSTVARLVDAPIVRRGSHATTTAFRYVTGLELDGYHWYYRRGTGVGCIPTNGGHCVFASAATAGDFAGRGRASRPPAKSDNKDFDHLVRTASPDLAASIASADRVEPLRRFPGVPGYLRQASGRGWALVGDAGYFKDPITAHGITDALRDAELCARAVVGGSDEALAGYQLERDRLSRELFGVTDSIASMAWTLDELQRLHRALSGAMRASVGALLALDSGAAAA